MARIVDEFRRALNGQAVAPADAPTSAASPHPQPAVSNTVARNAEEQTKIERLTNREQEVIKLIGLGLRNQQIADRLFISVITVRHHLSSVFSKLEVGDRFELAIYAYRNGLAQPPI
jgi:DNA-binding NarL/FixJ family response regulator